MLGVRISANVAYYFNGLFDLYRHEKLPIRRRLGFAFVLKLQFAYLLFE